MGASGVRERRVEVVKGRKRRCRKAGIWVAMMARAMRRRRRGGENCSLEDLGWGFGGGGVLFECRNIFSEGNKVVDVC